MNRPPAVAGQFYPAEAGDIEAELNRFIRPVNPLRRAMAVVVPHAGWSYSGATAGKVYSAIEIPDDVILVGPNHHGIGSKYALYEAGSWRTPIGEVRIAEALSAKLLERSELFTADMQAHRVEHSLEVQLPMLLRLNPRVQIVPLLIGGPWPEAGGREELRVIGQTLAKTIREYARPVLLVSSTDLNHYEDQGTSHVKDKLVLDATLQMDEDDLLNRVKEFGVSMCGVAPTYAVLVAAKQLGARNAELIQYMTSGDVTGDFSAVVGYGGIIIE